MTRLTRSMTVQWPAGPLPKPSQTGCWAKCLSRNNDAIPANRYAKKLLNCLFLKIFLDHCATSYLSECSQTHICVFARLLKQTTSEAVKNALTHLGTLRKNRAHTQNRAFLPTVLTRTWTSPHKRGEQLHREGDKSEIPLDTHTDGHI